MRENEFRLTSEVENFPWGAKTLGWLLSDGKGAYSSPHGMAEKRAALQAAAAGTHSLFITWPGQWSSSVFRVDNAASVTL